MEQEYILGPPIESETIKGTGGGITGIAVEFTRRTSDSRIPAFPGFSRSSTILLNT